MPLPYSDLTVIALYKTNQQNSDQGTVFFGETEYGKGIGLGYHDDNGYHNFQWGVIAIASKIKEFISEFNVQSLTLDTSQNELGLYLNGKNYGVSESSNISISSGIKVGQARDNQKLNGSIAEVLIFSKKINDLELAKINNYLSNKWNLTSTVDSDGDGLMDADDPEPTVNNLMGGTIQGIKLNLSGVVTTLAGSAENSGNTDATGTAARFESPYAITTDGNSLYIADTSNHKIRKVEISSGIVTTLAGSSIGSTDGTGTSAKFYDPYGITTDGSNLYVADYRNHAIRKIVISTGDVSTLAGSAGLSGSTDGTGSAAKFYKPTGITTDGIDLYVSDYMNHTIRKISISNSMVTTIAGLAGKTGSTDSFGTSARFNHPHGIITDGNTLFITEQLNHLIRNVDISSGEVTTIAGSAGSTGSTNGTGSNARFNQPTGITNNGSYLYVIERINNTIRKIQ